MKKQYITPEITVIKIDNGISLAMCSDDDNDKNHHHGNHVPEYDTEDYFTNNPF